MRSFVRRLGLAVLVAGGTACSLLVDLEGYDGVVALDGPRDGGDGAPDGAGPGVTPQDAGDGGGDAASDGGFCERNAGALFCQDFEGVVAADDSWSIARIEPADAGALLIEPLDGGSKTLVAVAGPHTKPATPWLDVSLTRSFPASALNHLHAEISVRPNLLGESAPIFLTLFFYEDVDGAVDYEPDYALYLWASPGNTVLQEHVLPADLSRQNNFLRGRLVVGEWRKLTIDVAIKDRKLRATSDGQLAFDEVDIPVDLSGKRFDLRVGVTEGYNADGNSAHLDDVLLTVE